LDALLGASTNTAAGTFDAAVLEFNVSSATNTNVVFEFMFASEEYPEYISEYNDLMAIWVNEVNIAVVPGTNVTVTVNQINGGCQTNIHDHPTQATHPQFYVDNHDPVYSALPPYSAPAPVYTLQYDGTTVVLTVQASLLANTNNPIKIAIADAGDAKLDAAVFIRAVVPCQ
jgi:hypothetical protein